MATNCPSCGTPVSDQERFCPNCGTRLNATQPPVRPPVEPTQVLGPSPGQAAGERPTMMPGPSADPGPQRRPFPWLFVILGVVGLCVVIGGIGAAGLFVIGSSSISQQTATAQTAAALAGTGKQSGTPTTVSGQVDPAATATSSSATGAVGGEVDGAGQRAAQTTTALARTAQVVEATEEARLAEEQATQQAIAAATATMEAIYTSGRQIFRDEFVDNRNNWFTGRFNEVETDTIEGGVFRVIWSGEGTSYELYDVRPLTNFIIEVDCVVFKGELDGSCGVIFGQKAEVGFYKYELFNDYYRLFVVQKDVEPKLLLEGDPKGIVNPNNTNRLRVIKRGDEISLYLNDQFLQAASDPTYPSGKIGVSTNSYNKDGGVEVWFDNFTIYELPG